MGKKWQRIDPAEIEVGDRVRVVDTDEGCSITYIGTITDAFEGKFAMGKAYLSIYVGTWYIRKPKKPKPPTRPDEPPVGTLFRVDRTGTAWLRLNADDYTEATGDKTYAWSFVTEPGDTIQLLKLVADDLEGN